MKSKQINKLYLIYDSSRRFQVERESEREKERETETEKIEEIEPIIKIKNICDDLIDFDFFSDEDYHY